MASGWRKLLEEESEHQWLAIGVFFIFIIIGGFLIGGTSSLEGMVLGTDASDDLVFEEGEFLIDIDYHQGASWDQAHSAILKTQTGLRMYQQMNVDDVDDILEPNDPAIENITLFSADEDGIVTFSHTMNTISTYVNGAISEKRLDDTYGSEFGINALATDTSSMLNNRLMITSEDGGSGLRGWSGQGIVSVSAPIEDPIIWDDVVYLEDSTFLAVGTYIINSLSESPASPELRVVLAHVVWEGDTSIAPQVLPILREGSEIHSLFRTAGGGAVASTNQEFFIVSSNTIQVFDYSSTSMVYEAENNRAWLFAERGSESVLRVDVETGTISSKNLAYALPLQPTWSSIEGDSFYLHGFNAQGEADRLSLDLTIEGSLSSGRGFLNFAFILVGVIMIATQAYMMVEKAYHTNSP